VTAQQDSAQTAVVRPLQWPDWVRSVSQNAHAPVLIVELFGPVRSAQPAT
jgi:hypothetical protein